ncbi:hypothetical protein NP493_53g10013 [Ridgeia piscesae]|uniref:CIDE-N domain-containing protein n=1 Tax=Ridgeia piscesae TaxID=27915 RepID=A0AAD9UJ97_RIDPI|nr:hypothetical protein NP493_53g10013 [Ridgeia piscesae]
MSEGSKPFKVWNAPRSVKKSVTAETLKELISKGKEKLRYGNEEVRVVLESDGTEVDDEEYFQFLEAQTTFIFLTQDDGEWMPAYEEDQIQCEDVTDTGATPSGNAEPEEDDTRSVTDLAVMLKKDFSMIHTLSRDEIQKLLDLSPAELGARLARSRRDAHYIQLMCQRHLDQMRDSDDAVQFLDLLKTRHLSANSSDAGDGPATKRNRLNSP